MNNISNQSFNLDQQNENNSYHHQNKDQEWYQKLGRGRGRGNGGRPSGGGNQTNAQRLLSSRHQEKLKNRVTSGFTDTELCP